VPLNQSNSTDDLDQAKVAVSDSTTGNTAAVELDGASKYAMRVIAQIDSAVPVQPGEDLHYAPEFLRNGSNKSMAVNGSSTPQVFNWTAPAGETWYVYGISSTVIDNNNFELTQFGALDGLFNGVLVEYSTNSTFYSWANLQDNRDLNEYFLRGKGHRGGKPEGFFDSEQQWGGYAEFPVPLTLTPGDEFRATVRDNLIGLTDFFIVIHKWRVV